MCVVPRLAWHCVVQTNHSGHGRVAAEFDLTHWVPRASRETQFTYPALAGATRGSSLIIQEIFCTRGDYSEVYTHQNFALVRVRETSEVLPLARIPGLNAHTDERGLYVHPRSCDDTCVSLTP